MAHARTNDRQAFLCLVVFAACIIAWGCKPDAPTVRQVGTIDEQTGYLCTVIGGEWGRYGESLQENGCIRVVPDSIMQARVEAARLGWLDGFTFVDAGVVWLSESLWARRDPERCAAVLLHELAHLRLHTLDEAKCDAVVTAWRKDHAG